MAIKIKALKSNALVIAHHQGAIDMANVELKYGDDQWAKEMAQKVIDAQTREIADMTAWLKDNSK